MCTIISPQSPSFYEQLISLGKVFSGFKYVLWIKAAWILLHHMYKIQLLRKGKSVVESFKSLLHLVCCNWNSMAVGVLIFENFISFDFLIHFLWGISAFLSIRLLYFAFTPQVPNVVTFQRFTSTCCPISIFIMANLTGVRWWFVVFVRTSYTFYDVFS